MKILKFFLFIIVLFAVFSIKSTSILEASDYNFSSGYKQEEIPLDLDKINSNKVNLIHTFFCNEGFEEKNLKKNINITTRPGKEEKICIIQYNLSNEDIYSWGAFPDNRIEIGGINGDRNCSDSHDRGNPFSKFIKQFPEDKVKIPANGYVIRKTTITFPVGISGMQYGCFAYGEANGRTTLEGSMIGLLIRKVNYINILVKGNDYTQIENFFGKIIKNKKNFLFLIFFIVLIMISYEIKKLFKKGLK